MKYAIIVISAATLAACDGLSVAQKRPEVRVVPASQPARDAKSAPLDPRLEADKILAARVKQALEQEEKALAQAIDVTVDSGRVTLWGTTAGAEESARVGKVALRVEGVKAVDNRIVVVKGS